MPASTPHVSSALEHFSHPLHSLVLKEDDIIAVDATCSGCNKQVIGTPTYSCSETACKDFYLHKTCAELPTNINHHKHNQHPLTLRPRRSCICNVCRRKWKWFTYTCGHCDFDVCALCAFQKRELRHEGHQEHTLTLMPRETEFDCDACGENDTDSFYVCAICEFWIHNKCAFSPLIIPDPTYHHHPLHLIYSIPDEHQYFNRFCDICDEGVLPFYWLYYCHKCTYFVHMTCATSLVSDTASLEDSEQEGVDNEPDLVLFPLDSEESLFELITAQCSKLLSDLQIRPISTMPNDPLLVEEHWSHKNHPLEILQFTISEKDSDDNYDDRGVLTCDGCIQPITISHPSYYGCIQCGFFLHSFCATKLPRELCAGASAFHPQHALLLRKRDRFYDFVTCSVCDYATNGFYYNCETCDIKIDIICAFLPTRIKHKSHKHPLVQRPLSNSVCSVSRCLIVSGREYACETCSNYQIISDIAFYPTRLKHKYDLHYITLREPPFFYEGVFYCEICEEQVDNQLLLYHCDDCDHSFHHFCLIWNENIKSGGTTEFFIENQKHTLALVLKGPVRKNSPGHICKNCREESDCDYFLECDGCGYLICRKCVIKVRGEGQSIMKRRQKE